MTRNVTFKTIIGAFACAAGLALGAGSSAAREAVVILSPHASTSEKLATVKAVAQHLAETVAPGKVAQVVNGMSGEEIGAFAVPDQPERFDNPRAKMRVNRAFFAALKHFAETDAPEGAFPGQIDLPGILRRVGASYPAAIERDLIFFKTAPIAHDDRSPGFSMQGGVVPNDGHLSASRADSLYGAKGEEALLRNYVVHWGSDGADWAVSDRHAHFLERFIAVSLNARGATLVTFATDGATALRNAKAGLETPLGPYELEATERRAMIHFQPKATAPRVSIYERELSEAVPTEAMLRAASRVEVAIRWTCDCDFDLAVKTPGAAQAISFRHPVTAIGTLFKDFRNARSLNNGFETVALPGPVDLSALLVAVNLYSGQAPSSSTAEIRVAVDGETWGRTFQVPASSGNGGRGFEETMRSGVAANPAWLVIDPVAVILGD